MKIPKLILYLWFGIFIAVIFVIYQFKVENQVLRNQLEVYSKLDSSTSRTDNDLGEVKEKLETPAREFRIVEEGGSAIEKRPDQLLRSFLLEKFREAGGFLRLNVFDGGGEITDAFAELYGLNDWEIEELSRESAKAREQHFQLAKANSEVSPLEDGGIRVVLNPFESDENIYADVLDSFQRVLGDDRFADFLDLGEAEMRNRFNQFGAEKLVVEITPKTVSVIGPDGQPVEVTKYSVTETKERADQTSTRNLNNIGEDYFSKEFDLIKRLIDEEDTEP